MDTRVEAWSWDNQEKTFYPLRVATTAGHGYVKQGCHSHTDPSVVILAPFLVRPIKSGCRFYSRSWAEEPAM